MADIVVEIAANTSRFKRDLDSIERDAKRTAVAVARSFADAEMRGFGVDQRSARSQRLAAEREINQRVEADRRDTMRRTIDAEVAEQGRLARRTSVFVERRRREWEEAEAKKSNAMGRTLRVAALVGAVAGLSRSVIRSWREYADAHGYAASMMGRTSAKLAEVRNEIGRTIAMGGSSVDRLGAGIVGGALGAYRAAQDTLVEMRYGLETRQELRGGVERMEALDAEQTRQQTFRRQRMEQEASGDGPAAERARAELERMDYAARVNDLVAQGKLSGSQASELVGSFRPGRAAADDSARRADRGALEDLARIQSENTAEGFRAAGDETGARIYEARSRAEMERYQIDEGVTPERRADLISAINKRRDAEIAAIQREDEERRKSAELEHAMALEAYELRAREAEIDELSATGKRREAELLREELRLREEINAIKRDDRITDEERMRLVGEATERSHRAAERIGAEREPVSVRSIATGVGDSLIRRSVLGPTAIPGQQLAEAKKQTGILERIEQKTGVTA